MTPNVDSYWLTRNPVGCGRDLLRPRSVSAPRPPGPVGRPFTGVLHEYRADPFEYVRELADEYGDVFKLPMPFYDVIVVNHPEHVGHVMNRRQSNYATVGSQAKLARSAGGSSLAMLHNSQIGERRKLLTPMINRRRLANLAAGITEEFGQCIASWEKFAASGAPVDLQNELPAVVMAAFIRAMFSSRMSDSETRQLKDDVASWLSVFFNASLFVGPIPRVLLGSRNPVQAWFRVHRWAKKQLDERNSDRQHDDMLQVIVDAHDRGNGPLSRRDAITEITTLVFGGWESVATALGWTLALLPRNPDAQQRLYDEVDELGGAMPTYDDLSRLQWVKACFDESQRLRGLPFLLRVATTYDEIGGYRIRPGNLIAIQPFAIHRDPRWWGMDAETYDPTRFCDKNAVASRPNLAFIPFGAGPLRCIGSAFGEMSAQFFLTQLHQRFRVRFPNGWMARRDVRHPLLVRGGLPAVLTKTTTASV